MAEDPVKDGANRALVMMLAVQVPAIITFWLVYMRMHNPAVAFAVLVIGLLSGAGIYVYRIRKLRSKE